MRVTIVHNPGSGEQALTGPELIARVRSAGHQPTYASTADPPAVAKLLADPGDLVAIVGGDGTMRDVAMRLIGRDVPVTLIPTGTANNIGRTLGIVGEATDLIAGWHGGRLIGFDCGIVRGSTQPCPLLEGMGFGPIAVTIAALSPLTAAEASAEWTAAEVRRDLKVLREVLADYPVHQCRVTLDGRDLSGEYILVEAMNIRSVGPNVALAPDADVSDGLFDLVLLADADRAALRDYLTERLEGSEPVLRVPVHRGRHVELSWKGSRVHIDDQVWPHERDASSGKVWSRDGRVELEVLMNPAALQVLVPASPDSGVTASPS
jgi:diacylglycerol kinase family enzyme